MPPEAEGGNLRFLKRSDCKWADSYVKEKQKSPIITQKSPVLSKRALNSFKRLCYDRTPEAEGGDSRLSKSSDCKRASNCFSRARRACSLILCSCSFMCVTYRINKWHDTFIRGVTHLYTWHDSFIYVTWLMGIRDITHTRLFLTSTPCLPFDPVQLCTCEWALSY